jgi:hypothetical protein
MHPLHTHTRNSYTGGDASSACFDKLIRVSCCHKTGFEIQRCAARSSGGQLLRVHGGRLGSGGAVDRRVGGGGLDRRHRLGLELGDVVAERRAGVVGGGHLRRLVLAHLDEDGRGRGDGDEDQSARDGRRVLGPVRRRARRAGADGALRHVHRRLHARFSQSTDSIISCRCYLISFKKGEGQLRSRPTKPGLVV